MKTKKHIISILIILFFLIPQIQATQKIVEQKNVTVVLDISRSMNGDAKNAKNIFPSVINEVSSIVESLAEHDIFSLILFGTDTKTVISQKPINAATKKNILKTLKKLKATSNFTGLQRMFKKLNDYLEESQILNQPQIALLFTDAINAPRIKNGDFDLNEVLSQCYFNKGSEQKIYFFSLSEKYNESFKNNNQHCFNQKAFLDSLDIKVKERKIKNYADLDLIPAIKLSDNFVQSLKAGSENHAQLLINVNDKVVDAQLHFEVVNQDKDHTWLSIEKTTLELNQGNQFIPITINIPKRADAQLLDLQIRLQIDSEQEIVILPKQDKYAIQFEVIPLNFSEKLQSLPEFYIPFIILILILIYILFKFFKYITFQAELELSYWITPPKQRRVKRNKGEQDDDNDDSPILTKNTISILDWEKNEVFYFCAQNARIKEEVENRITLNELKPNQILTFKRINEDRYAKLKATGSWLVKTKNKKRIGSTKMKNNSSFEYGNYSFEVKTNIK